MKALIVNIIKWVLNIVKESQGESIKFRRGSHFYSNTLIDTLTPQMVEIGNNFISAPGSIITAHDASTFLFTKKYRVEKIIIGNNVFLGANSVILPGIQIGNNVIVGAGSIVTKDIPSNSVVAGNPAKVIMSVQQYMDKCDKRGVLYEVPDQLMKEFENEIKFSAESISKFQDHVVKRYNKGSSL